MNTNRTKKLGIFSMLVLFLCLSGGLAVKTTFAKDAKATSISGNAVLAQRDRGYMQRDRDRDNGRRNHRRYHRRRHVIIFRH